jgi:hypothetical protein
MRQLRGDHLPTLPNLGIDPNFHDNRIMLRVVPALLLPQACAKS